MSKIIIPVEAVIEFVTDLKEGQYGVYKSVLFKTSDGEKIWKSFPLDSEELSILSKGARVRLIPNGSTRSGKPSHVIELVDGGAAKLDTVSNGQNSEHLGKPTDGLTDDQKRQIAAYIEQMGTLYRFAYGQAAQHLKGMTDEPDTLRSCAATLFIAAQRRFNL
jgi:hypothetical protein